MQKSYYKRFINIKNTIMAKVCDLTGIKVQFGNNVSHSVRRTRRCFFPNLHNVTLRSELLNSDFKFKVTTKALRTVEVRGGLDNFLLASKINSLSKHAAKLRKKIKDKKAS